MLRPHGIRAPLLHAVGLLYFEKGLEFRITHFSSNLAQTEPKTRFNYIFKTFLALS